MYPPFVTGGGYSTEKEERRGPCGGGFETADVVKGATEPIDGG